MFGLKKGNKKEEVKEEKIENKKKKKNLSLVQQFSVVFMFIIGILLVIIGLIIDIQPIEEDTLVLNFIKCTTFFNLLVQLFITSGTAIIISGVFSIVIGTQNFLEFINEKIINKMSSSEYVERLAESEKKKLAKEVFRPSIEMANIYKPTEKYFENFIEKGLKMFKRPFRSDLNIDIFCFFDEEKKVVTCRSKVRYRTYKFHGKHEPFQTGLENEDDSFEQVKFYSADGEVIEGEYKILNKDDPRCNKNISEDSSVNKMGICEVPEEFNKLDSFIIERSAIEYGNDHWHNLIYKNLSPINTLTMRIRCDQGIIVKKIDSFSANASIKINETPNNKVDVICAGWVEPGFGLSAIIGLKD
ncbi:hypothetical protein [uncultured Draconibacterium sp.]|uniref:hypothetical protein n=1 Tax=uncultured Draconibacterium sp. TaxID=1573823 RepID=UPI0025D971A0|nr:hypothetical protein [uncultured Draconibacterium sp.]